MVNNDISPVNRQDSTATLLSNRIYANSALAIDINGDGVTLNDLDDVDTGPNGFQNFPVIASAESANGMVTIVGTLNSGSNNAQYFIQFFGNNLTDPSGYGEGQTLIGSTLVTTGNSIAHFNVAFPSAVAPGTYVSATATDSASGSTSEFSLGKVVTSPSSLSISVGDVSINEGNSGLTDVGFNVTLSAPSAQAVSVSYSTDDGFPPNPASEGVDFVGTSGTLTFAPGETLKQVGVKIKGDTTVETDEVFILALSNPVGATIVKNQGFGTIVNDDSANGPSSFQFQQSVYVTPEDSTKISITVTRSGDLSGAASVDYATDDDNATERNDYTTALGTIRFAPGEATKTFDLLITEDSLDEIAAESLFLDLSNPSPGTTLGAQSTATVQVTDDFAEPAWNVNDDPGMFVRQHYHDFLNREADAEGLAFWQNEILSCGSEPTCLAQKRQNVSAAFFLSIEFQETGFLIHRLTKTSFDKLPRYRDFVRDSRALGEGLIVGQAGWEQKLEANKQAFLASWVGRTEFTSKYGAMTNEQYVDALFANGGVVPSAPERQALIDGLNNLTLTRTNVLRTISESAPVTQNETNRAFVLMQYFGYLRRNPDDAPDANMGGYNFWLTKLNQFNGDFQQAEMVKAFLIATEYRSRFGTP